MKNSNDMELISISGHTNKLQEFYNFHILLRVSFSASGLTSDKSIARFAVSLGYVFFYQYQYSMDSLARFSSSHIFVARREYCSPLVIEKLARIPKQAGRGALLTSEVETDSVFILGLSVQEILTYLQALYLCMKDRGAVPTEQSAGVNKKSGRYRNRSVTFLFVTEDETEIPVFQIPAAVIFNDEASAEDMEILRQIAVAEEYEPAI